MMLVNSFNSSYHVNDIHQNILFSFAPPHDDLLQHVLFLLICWSSPLSFNAEVWSSVSSALHISLKLTKVCNIYIWSMIISLINDRIPYYELDISLYSLNYFYKWYFRRINSFEYSLRKHQPCKMFDISNFSLPHQKYEWE